MKVQLALIVGATICVLFGCESTDQGSCNCELVTKDRLSPTFQCAAPDLTAPAALCETDGDDLFCEDSGATSATFSGDDLSCEQVFCISDDEETCHTECACSD